MLNSNIYKLFNYYTHKNHYKSQDTCIYRYRFKCDLDFKEIYIKLIEIFEIARILDDGVPPPPHDYLEAIFIVQNVHNEYYFTFFRLVDTRLNFSKEMEKQFSAFNVFLNSIGVDYIIYTTDKENRKRYESGEDVEFTAFTEIGTPIEGWKEKRPYSYWNWLYDITNSEIKLYILMDSPSYYYSFLDEKNIYNLRKFILELSTYRNFYFLHFNHAGLPVCASDIEEVLSINKSLTLNEEKESYQQLKNMNSDFNRYWSYESDPESFIPLYLVGFIDTVMLFKREIFYTEVEFLDTECKGYRSVYELFDKSLKTVEELDFVLMYRPVKEKNYMMLFVTKPGCNTEVIQKKIQDVVHNYCKCCNFETVDKLKYDFYIPEDRFTDWRFVDDTKYRHIKIEINSVVFGWYADDEQFWVALESSVNEVLIRHEIIRFFIEAERYDWFKETDLTFMSHCDTMGVYTFLKLK